MASMVQQSPPEILAAICGIIADDDERNTLVTHETKFKTLKILSRACRAFLPHCRRHIFHSITIHDHYNPKNRTPELFTRLIEGTPEIAEYVRTLRYGLRLHDDLHFAGVAATLDRLTSVRSLALSIHSYPQNWKDIPPSTEISLLKLIRSPSLVSLELRYIGGLDLGLFLPCPNLQSLYLHSVTFYDKNKDKDIDSEDDEEQVDTDKVEKVNTEPLLGSVGPVGRIQLQNLRVEKTPDDERCSISMLFDEETQDGHPVLDLSALKSVSLLISKEYQVALAKTILSKAPQVESIEMTGEDDELMESGAAAIAESGSALSALKSLTFKVYPVNPNYRATHPLPGICKALSSIAPKANGLEFINIHVTLFTETFTEQGDKWRDLERTLLASEWASLRRVQLDITSYIIGRNKAMEQLKDLPNTQFPSLSQDQHKFTFAFSVFSP